MSSGAYGFFLFLAILIAIGSLVMIGIAYEKPAFAIGEGKIPADKVNYLLYTGIAVNALAIIFIASASAGLGKSKAVEGVTTYGSY